jgi:hypothetical protein
MATAQFIKGEVPDHVAGVSEVPSRATGGARNTHDTDDTRNACEPDDAARQPSVDHGTG